MEVGIIGITITKELTEIDLGSIKTENINRSLFYIGYHKGIGLNLHFCFFEILRSY